MNYKNQKVSLNDSSFVLILKKRDLAAGLENCDKISGHSLRIGSISLARLNGVPKYEIMANHLKKKGKLSNWMMRNTTRVQVNIDYTSEDDFIKKYVESMKHKKLNKITLTLKMH